MKIAIIGSAFPLRGGIAAYVERLALEFQNKGHEVTIYSYSLQYPSLLFPGKSQFSEEAAPSNLKIETVINTINPINWIKIGNQIRENKPDVIFVKYWMSYFAPSLGTIFRQIRRNKHTKIVCIADNIKPHEGFFLDSVLTKFFLKPVDGIIAMSDSVLDEAQKICNKPTLLALHPLYDNYGEPIPREVALKKLSLPAENKYLLFFGFIRKYKGLDLLLEAMNDPEIRPQNIHLIVAGEYYGDKDFYESIIARHRLGDKIHLFTEFIAGEEVKNFFCAADCVVLPYRSATQSGISQIAFQFEKGMIATNVGGLPEVVKDGYNGLVCPPDAQSLAATILRFFGADRPKNLESNLKLEKQHYSWNAFSDKILKFAQAIS